MTQNWEMWRHRTLVPHASFYGYLSNYLYKQLATAPTLYFVLKSEFIDIIPESINIHLFLGVQTNELDFFAYAWICVFSVTVHNVHLPKLVLKVGHDLAPLGLGEEVKVCGNHNDWRFRSSAFNLFQPGLEALQTFFSVSDIPEEQIQGAASEKTLMCRILLMKAKQKKICVLIVHFT